MIESLPKPNAILWDMDGTLIDQTASIIQCYQRVVTDLGMPTPEPEKIRRSLGGPMIDTMRLFVEDSQLDFACRSFREKFPSMMCEGLIILPGAIACIERFATAGIAQGILTNKHGVTARAVSKHCGFDTVIKECIGNGDTEWSKPNPELSKTLLSAIGMDEGKVCLIGDSPTDVATALAIESPCLAVATGAHSEKELKEAGATATYPDLEALYQQLTL